MVRLANHRKNLRGGGPPLYLNVNYEEPTNIVSTNQFPEKTVQNVMREMRRAAGVQANTPTSIAAELSTRHVPVTSQPEKKPGFFKRLFGRTQKNTKNTGEKKPGFFKRLFGRTQKKNSPSEKKPGFFNRFRRTQKVQPQAQPLAIRPPPSPPQLAPAPAPPTPPAVSIPATPQVGPLAFSAPATIKIPTKFNLELSSAPGFLTKEEFDKKYVQEDFDKCVMRVAWYLKQRLAGKTHDELLPNLQRPGSMTMTIDDLEELRQRLKTLYGLPENEEFKAKKEELFGRNIDREIDAWEHGYPVNPIPLHDLQSNLSRARNNSEKQTLRTQIQQLQRRHTEIMREYCNKNICILYKDTPQEVMAQGNVGNGLHRYLPNLFAKPDFIQWRTNQQRAVYCTDSSPCYQIGSFDSLKFSNDNELISLFDPNYDGICVTDVKKYLGQITRLEKRFFMSMRYVIDLFVGGQVYFITPNFAVFLQQQFPELLTAAFGPYVNWDKLSKATALRMLTVQYFTAISLALETDDPTLAKKIYETYPQPALGFIQMYSKEKLEQFSTFFREVQKREGIKPVELSAYVKQLLKLKNIQVQKTIQPYQPQVRNWVNSKTVKSANNNRRNAAREAIAKARLENSSILPYNERFLSVPSYNITKRARNNAKTQEELKSTLNAGFGQTSAPSGLPPSAYETIPEW